MADLPTKMEPVTVPRITAKCALCGREAVVVKMQDYLEAGHDPLDPNARVTRVEFNYGSSPLRYSMKTVFVEQRNLPGSFTKRQLLVCNECSGKNNAPLLMKILEDTPK